MSEQHGRIVAFVATLRQRVNRHRLWTSLVWAIVAGAAAIVLIGLWFTLSGFAVPWHYVVWIAGLAIVGGLVGWIWKRLTFDHAASLADRFFSLHDTIASYLHFSESNKQDGYYALQANKTYMQVRSLNPKDIRYQPPHRAMLLATGLVAIAVPLSLKGTSEAMKQKQLLEEVTYQETTIINEQLKEAVEEVKLEIQDPLEKELVDPDKLHQWIEQLSASKNLKEALRQYARLERDINEARLATQRKQDEQLLDQAAKELGIEEQTNALAKSFQRKQYRQADQLLAKLKLQTNKSLSQQRRELARLKATSQRMATAARLQTEKNTSTGLNRTGLKRTGQHSQASSGQQINNGKLAQSMKDLAEAVDQFDESLQQAVQQESQQGECSAEQKSKCQLSQQKVNNELEKMRDGLNKLATMRQAENKLIRLSKTCSNCQSQLSSACRAGQSSNANGKKAGWGSNSARRDTQNELNEKGQTMRLQGAKRSGPSIKSVEAADDGTGVASRKTTQHAREFRKQFESFVQREDIPEQVKQGVKRYFEIIHQNDSIVNHSAPEQRSSEDDGGRPQ